MGKRILCIGDSNTWGYIPGSGERYEKNVRWTGKLAQTLGENYEVIEEGMNGRTTAFTDKIEPGTAALDYLYPCLISQFPLDYIIVMLGTNDTKTRYGVNTVEIGYGLDEVKKKVDRLAELDRQMAAVKGEMETIKAWFEKQATDDLRDTKNKTVEYWGSENSKVVVGNSETVKPISMTMVKKLLGDVFKDFVKEDVSYSMSAPAKRLFSMMYMGNFTEGSLDATISAITKDEKIQRTLKKKLKGKYEKDTETLMKLVGLSEQEASDWAYLASEVINWEWMLQILKAAEWGGTPQEAVEVIRAAIFVDEGIKVTVESEK
jgi:hypothetical protein